MQLHRLAVLAALLVCCPVLPASAARATASVEAHRPPKPGALAFGCSPAVADRLLGPTEVVNSKGGQGEYWHYYDHGAVKLCFMADKRLSRFQMFDLASPMTWREAIEWTRAFDPKVARGRFKLLPMAANDRTGLKQYVSPVSWVDPGGGWPGAIQFEVTSQDRVKSIYYTNLDPS